MKTKRKFGKQWNIASINLKLLQQLRSRKWFEILLIEYYQLPLQSCLEGQWVQSQFSSGNGGITLAFATPYSTGLLRINTKNKLLVFSMMTIVHTSVCSSLASPTNATQPCFNSNHLTSLVDSTLLLVKTCFTPRTHSSHFFRLTLFIFNLTTSNFLHVS